MRLELEDKILAHMQEKLTHHKAAKYSQRLTSKTAALKKEKVRMRYRKNSKSRVFQYTHTHTYESNSKKLDATFPIKQLSSLCHHTSPASYNQFVTPAFYFKFAVSSARQDRNIGKIFFQKLERSIQSNRGHHRTEW